MGFAGLTLTEREQAALESLAQRTGRTPNGSVHDAVKQLITPYRCEGPLSLPRQAPGTWKDRTDLRWRNHAKQSEA